MNVDNVDKPEGYEKLKGKKMVLTKRKWFFGKRLYIVNQLCFEMSVTDDLYKAQIFYIDEPIDACRVEDDFLFTRWRLKSFETLRQEVRANKGYF